MVAGCLFFPVVFGCLGEGGGGWLSVECCRFNRPEKGFDIIMIWCFSQVVLICMISRWWFQICFIFTLITWRNDPNLTSIFFSNGFNSTTN